ncbi:MAG: TetR/AcrR family transcriptional regulator [Burkholderiaceae bacterium]
MLYGMVIITSMIAIVNTFWYGDDMEEKKNRRSWLNAGLQALAGEGPDGLRIMLIAQHLGVTKGSFYWHFKSLEEYQTAVLEEWEQSHTQEIIERVEHTGGDAKTKLRNLFVGTISANFSLSRAIRSWSLSNPNVREVQARVDQKRVDYVAKLLRGIGWSKEDALTLGRWGYCAFIGHATLNGPPITEKQLNLILATMMPK